MYTILVTPEFNDWHNSVKNPVASAAITARLRRAGLGSFGDHKSVGDGVSEMRIDTGAGYRLYYTIRGRVMVVMLCGGDKSTQQKDIKVAKKMASELED